MNIFTAVKVIKRRSHYERGFTLIEMMVSVSIFAMVMMVGVGALLSLVATNHRAQAINSVMNNLNAALENMSRSIRVGTLYNCVTSAAVPPPPPVASEISNPRDCASGGGRLLAFESSQGDPNDSSDQVVYRLNGKQIERSLKSGANGTWVAITAPEVSIDTFDFYVIGSTQGDSLQPRVLMRIKGSAKVPGGTTTFTVQASVVQRVLDI
ncbi:prepilin-type N-terminal cleavage/methylation domain-containing protein [Patescibacteria group bacterium]|nr:MAG: prepilin-type N-terminal cleavage/methylation domain-containing protein [Patescibacteria group bacterium]